MCSTGGGAEQWQAVQAAAQVLAGEDVIAWSDEQVRDGLQALLPVVNQLTAVVSALSASFDTRRAAERDGFRSARSWLIAYGRMSQGAATGWLSRGRLLRQLPALSAAAHAGAVSAEHLRVVDELAGHIGVAKVQPFDEILATLAATTRRYGDMAQACHRIRAYVDPDGPDPDPDAGERRTLSIARVGSLFSISGRLDAEGGATLITALDALMKPAGPDDNRTGLQRRADALVEVARQTLDRATLPTVGGARPQLGILITPEALLGLRHLTGTATTSATADSPNAAADARPPGTASTSDPPRPRTPDVLECAGVPPTPDLPWNTWADRLPAWVAQRIACDCEVWRVILDPATGLPLEVGRAHRIVPTWIRKALHARDRGCRWPGCTAPADWTEVHHLIAWQHGGLTNVDNCLLMCRHHHGLVHHDRPDHQRWHITLDPTTGDVTVTRPGGQPYELGPSQPYRPTTPEARTRGPD